MGSMESDGCSSFISGVARLRNKLPTKFMHIIHDFLSVAVAAGTFATPGVALLPPGCCPTSTAELLSESTT